MSLIITWVLGVSGAGLFLNGAAMGVRNRWREREVEDLPEHIVRLRRELRQKAVVLLAGLALLVITGALVWLPLATFILALELLWYAGVLKAPRRGPRE